MLKNMENTVRKVNNNAFFRQLVFLAALITVGVTICAYLSFWVGSVLGALTLYIVFRNVLFRMTEKWRWPRWIAALALTLLCLVIIGAIGYFTVQLIVKEIPSIDTTQIIPGAQELVTKINNAAGFTVISQSLVEKTGGVMATFLAGVLNTTYSFAANVFMMLVIVYFMFAAGRKMECYIYRYMPFKGRSLSLLRSEFKDVVYSNAVGIPVILIGQTAVATLLYWLIGLDNFLFWGFLTGLCGLIPLVGAALVWVPMAIYYAVQGQLWVGIGIALYGVIVISNTDNVIRIVLMKKFSDTHPLVVIFGVIIGIPLFGFWGIIFGPLLISIFLLLVRIYYVEYGLLTPVEEAERLAYNPSERENPVPFKSLHDIHAVKAYRMLRTARPDHGAPGKTENDDGAVK